MERKKRQGDQAQEAYCEKRKEAEEEERDGSHSKSLLPSHFSFLYPCIPCLSFKQVEIDVQIQTHILMFSWNRL